MGSVWRDWVLIGWNDEGTLSCHIWGFVDLSDINEDIELKFEKFWIESGIYVIVEVARPVDDEFGWNCSQMFSSYSKEVGGILNNRVALMSFYLADVESTIGPVAVIPNIGGAPNNYLRIKNREEWGRYFTTWLDGDLSLIHI